MPTSRSDTLHASPPSPLCQKRMRKVHVVLEMQKVCENKTQEAIHRSFNHNFLFFISIGEPLMANGEKKTTTTQHRARLWRSSYFLLTNIWSKRPPTLKFFFPRKKRTVSLCLLKLILAGMLSACWFIVSMHLTLRHRPEVSFLNSVLRSLSPKPVHESGKPSLRFSIYLPFKLPLEWKFLSDSEPWTSAGLAPAGKFLPLGTLLRLEEEM